MKTTFFVKAGEKITLFCRGNKATDGGMTVGNARARVKWRFSAQTL